MTFRAGALWFAIAFGCARSAAGLPPALPVYIEESHAGSFYWLAEHLDLDRQYTLIHFDAHSDASALFDSDNVRERLRRVSAVEERHALLERWRATGLIQCFNWIEPLMPEPIANLIWVPRQTPGSKEVTALRQESARHLDGHLEAAPRRAGSFAERTRAVALDDLPAEVKEGTPTIITIDLDYFAGLAPRAREKEFERVWKFVAGCRNLHAVTIAISRPYLSGDEEADALLRLALRASLSLPTANIQFEPFARVGHDRSLRAQELRAQKRAVPAFNVANASAELRALLLANRARIAAERNAEGWQRILADWEAGVPAMHLAVRGRDPSTDKIWRVPVAEPAEVELQTAPAHARIERVEWVALVPEQIRCNLTAEQTGETGFAAGAPPRPRFREITLRGNSRTLPMDSLRDLFDRASGCGAVRLKGRAHINGRLRESAAIEVRRFAGAGFRAALTEQFGLPYLFGSGELRNGANTGPETGWGADCANFVVYALRRQGRPVPWSNPKQLRKYLEPVKLQMIAGEAGFSEEDVAGGLVIHFGNHVAALMEDRPPLGMLDETDLVAHQLEGAPEMLSLGQLLQARKAGRFDLLRAPHPSGNVDLLLGGDVMLGRTVGAAIEQGADPLEGIRPWLENASARLVNLECVLSDKGTAPAGKRYSLRAPLDAARVLRAARMSAVSLANNHANDFGREALLDSMAHLRASDVIAIGAGDTIQRAFAPHFFATPSGTKGAIIALSDVDDGVGDGPIARARDRERVAAALAEARARASFILAFVHWGDENTNRVNARQRELARWLIDRGADAVVGSHPHCLQPFDAYHGRPIIYSLGNLVFDGAPTLPGWNRGQLLEVDAGQPGMRQPSFRLVPVKLDARGVPRVVEGESRERRFTNRRRKGNAGLEIAAP